jgi:hypothetical protein
MNFDSRVDSERVVIASALLVGWAIWTAWRHLILPALIAGGGLVLLAAGWRPEPAPVPVGVLPPMKVRKGEPASLRLASDAVQWVQVLPPADQPLSKRVSFEPMLEVWSHDLDGEPTLQNVTTVKDLPPAVRQQIRASLDRLSRDA